jgi:apolipoprotein N-acyltransferase
MKSMSCCEDVAVCGGIVVEREQEDIGDVHHQDDRRLLKNHQSKTITTNRQLRHLLTLLGLSIATSLFSDTSYLPILAIIQPAFFLAYCHACHRHKEIHWCKKYVLGGFTLFLFRALPAGDYFLDDSRIVAYVTGLVVITVFFGIIMVMGIIQSSIWIDSERYYGGADQQQVSHDANDLESSSSGENAPLSPPTSNVDTAITLPPITSSKRASFLYSTHASTLAFPILFTTLFQLLFRFSPIGGAGNPAMGLAQVSGLRQVASLFGEIYLVFWIGWLASIVVGVGIVLGEGGWLDNLIERVVVVFCSCCGKEDDRRRRSHPVRREMNHVAVCHVYTFGVITIFMFIFGSVRELIGRGIYLQNISLWPTTQAGASPLQVSCLTNSDRNTLINRTNERLAAGDDLVIWSEGAGGIGAVTPDMFEWNAENTGAVVAPTFYDPIVDTSLDYNKMEMMQNDQVVSTYSKNRPVPVMEPGIKAGATIPNVTPVAFTPKQSSLSSNNVRQAVNLKTSMAICFDFDFPYLFHNSSNADIVLGASWYWASIGFIFWEHNIFRAIENGFTIIKCSYDGITGAVDPYGRTLAAVPSLINEVHLMEVPVQRGVRTLYGICGWVFGWICTFLSPMLLILFVWEKIKQKRASSQQAATMPNHCALEREHGEEI